MASVSQLRDHLNLTRTTELQKGSWLSLVSPIPEYPFYTTLVPRAEKKTSQTVSFTISSDEVGKTTNLSGFFKGVGSPLQPASHASTRRTSTHLAKSREETTYAEDEEALQGTADEQLNDQILMRKVEQLDFPLMAKTEFCLARSPGGSEVENEIFGLPYWLPHNADATAALDLAGGTDPVGYAGGAAGVTVAQVPGWAHATAGFANISDSSFFNKIDSYLRRVNAYVPSGTKPIDAAEVQRCGLMQHPVATVWSALQQNANDNPGRDLGQWRDAIWYSSIPFKVWHAISEPASPVCPVGYGLLYLLDLSTWKYFIHSTYGGAFSLQMREPQDQPGVIWLFREGYSQLVCVRRNRNLVMYTDTTDLISVAS